jgi:predicted nucleic-acid-binding protein
VSAARVAVDTNVVLRFLLDDSPAEARAVERFLVRCREEGTRAFVGVLVIQECAWVLSGPRLARSRTEVAQALSALARGETFLVECEAAVLRACEDWLRGPADFSDYLIGRVNEERGYPQTTTLEKRKLRSSPVFRSLKG